MIAEAKSCVVVVVVRIDVVVVIVENMDAQFVL